MGNDVYEKMVGVPITGVSAIMMGVRVSQSTSGGVGVRNAGGRVVVHGAERVVGVPGTERGA